jgi:PhnB protein
VTTVAEIDLRPGGIQRTVMRMPDGTEHHHRGVYLEVVPGRRLVFTTAYVSAWEPAPEPQPGTCSFPMTGILTFEPEGTGTRYTALIRHQTVADRETHEKMGFHAGWNQATDQLAELVESSIPIATPPPLSCPAGRTVSPYLNFDGRCSEAIAFYREALGAEVDALMRFKDAPPAEGCTQSNPDLIMHAALRIGGTLIMASDCHGTGKPAFAGISLALAVLDAADAERTFQALSAGGNVCMPLGATFWSPAFGVVTDRFGVTWMINTIAPTPGSHGR